ncbi:MAG: palindromic element RPE1 domain-containing protein [Holosporaceae bacterium]|nr:palindromic element RPE1 domain-containing protein [Holosporaceae bacterium]
MRSLSKPSNFEEFSGVTGAQNRSVLEVREDSSTGTTQKLPEGRWLRKRSIILLEGVLMYTVKPLARNLHGRF